MYPRIVEIPLPFEVLGTNTLTIFSFGAMLAIAFLTAAWLTRLELDRLHRNGRLPSIRVQAPSGGKGKGKKPRMVDASPSHLVGTMTVIAIAGGLVGAKIFHILENLGEFAADPFGMIFSTGGLTFYGGLIVAAASVLWYMRKHRVPVALLSDAILPTVLLAYGIGRIGCHLAGDGDWGIPSDPAMRPDWIPGWLWGETYPANILGRTLPETGVYPTPLYEFGMAAVFFGILWVLRRHPFQPGWLFSLTLIFFGVERFLIEQIRVNNTFELFGMSVTQAEVISVVLIVAGLTGLILTTRKRKGRSRA